MELTKWRNGKAENGYGDDALILHNSDVSILSIERLENGDFRFREECDGCFFEDHTKADALILVDELKRWIEAQN